MNQNNSWIEKPVISDAKEIRDILYELSQQNLLLARSVVEIMENIREFVVYRSEQGVIEACCALTLWWEEEAEIRSLAVRKDARGENIGARLIDFCLGEARDLGAARVFTLTYIPEYFKKFGFRLINKESLPRKIWTICTACPKFPDCDETALVREIGNE